MPASPRSTRAVYIGLAITLGLTLLGAVAALALGLIGNGITPTETNFLLFNSSIALFAMAGGFVTAKLAPHSPKDHSISLGTILTVLGLVASIAFSLADYGPKSFGWLLVLTGLPFAWLGGKLKRERERERDR
jgi:peptidoglycan/LPS O-acetylase OafA/YrhL